MPEIRIVGAPKDLINNIDSLVEKSNCTDRSTYLIEALKEYCLYHDKYFLHCLPDTTRILSEDVMQKLKEHDTDTLIFALRTIKNSNRLIKQLYDILSGDNDIETDDNDDIF